MSSDRLVVAGLRAAWGRVPVLRGVDLSLSDGECVTLIGPNGSGKTTLLRCIAGLEPVVAGSIHLDGLDLRPRPPHRRGVGLVSQEGSLFPHRTVRENIAYGPLVRGTPEPTVAARVQEMMRTLSIAPLADRYPGQLSGGEQQRVALARALAPAPPVVLLDEPFAAVDPEFRAELRGEFRAVLREQGTAALHVTHDREEGLFLGDRVCVLLEGAIVQSGAPAEVFSHPADGRVATFLGYNVIETPTGPIAVAPGDLEIDPPDAGGPVALVRAVGFVGREWSVVLQLDGGARAEARVAAERAPARPGQVCSVRWNRSIALPSPRRTPGGTSRDGLSDGTFN